MDFSKDSLGDRMKNQYENRTRYFLPRRTYTIVRIDGKAFHTYASECEKPFSEPLMGAMDRTAAALCKEIQGAKFAYVQSDEISILLTDFEKISTNAFFDGNIQKMASVSASLATGFFNDIVHGQWRWGLGSIAFFDARVFTVADPVEVSNYLVWRQQDATRNAISMVGHSLYSHKELEGKSTSDVQEMIYKKGKNFNDYPVGCKRGRMIVSKEVERPYLSPFPNQPAKTIKRHEWTAEGPPIFTKDKTYLQNLIPVHPDFCWKIS